LPSNKKTVKLTLNQRRRQYKTYTHRAHPSLQGKHTTCTLT